MFKTNKRKVLEFKYKNNTPLLSADGKGEINRFRDENIKRRIRLKKIEDINGMKITYGVIKKKIRSLFTVNYNKSAKSCNPCMDACKKVNKKINGRELSNVSNKEMKNLIKFFPLD